MTMPIAMPRPWESSFRLGGKICRFYPSSYRTSPHEGRSSRSTVVAAATALFSSKKQPLAATPAAMAAAPQRVDVIRAADPNLPTHLIFGANTDVGKTVIIAGLVRSALLDRTRGKGASDEGAAEVNYIKPLQCGGSDEKFVARHASRIFSAGNDPNSAKLNAKTLFDWSTYASPHVASLLEEAPVSDDDVLSSLHRALDELTPTDSDRRMTTFVETAGGVLSPGPSSPLNLQPHHARPGPGQWGWSTQADLYAPLGLPTVLVGDGRLGGISCTLAAIESLVSRGYKIHGVVLLESEGGAFGNNADALRDYVSRPLMLRSKSLPELRSDPMRSIMSLPPLPPEPEPLDGWFADPAVSDRFDGLYQFLNEKWAKDAKNLRDS